MMDCGLRLAVHEAVVDCLGSYLVAEPKNYK